MKEEVVSYSYARNNLKAMMDMACYNHESVMITRQSGGNVVLMSEEDFDGLMETLHLMSSKKNFNRLKSALNGGAATTYKNLNALKNAYKI